MQGCQAKRKEKIAGKSGSERVELATNRVLHLLQLHCMISALSVSRIRLPRRFSDLHVTYIHAALATAAS